MAAAAPNGNSNVNHHLLQGDSELNPVDQVQVNDIDRVLERSLIRRIRVLGDTIRRLQRLFTFTQANNPGPAALLRIIGRINRANSRRSTLYAQLHTFIRRRRRRQEQEQQVHTPPPPPPGNITNGNASNNNGAAPAPPPAA